MVKKIVITTNNTTFHMANTKFESDVELNNDTIETCLEMINCKDSASNYQICLLANDTILRVKPL